MSTVPLEPTNPHEITVQAFLAQLRAMQQAIPGYTFLGNDVQASLNATASVSDRFLELVGLACDGSEQFASSSDLTGPQVRDTVAYSRAYTTLLNALEVMVRGLRHTIIIHRGRVGEKALRAYSLAKSYNRKRGTPVVPELREMGIALNRGRRKVTPVVDAPPALTPPPATPVAPAAVIPKKEGSSS